MPRNELVLLDRVLADRTAARSEPMQESAQFELFAAEQLLRSRDLSEDEIEAGIVGGGNDGAIDGIYTFLGDVLLSEDSAVFDDPSGPSRVPHGTPLSLVLIQAKLDESFTETAIDLAATSTQRLLDLDLSDSTLRSLYSDAVVAHMGLFRSAVQLLATRHPRIDISFHYVTRGNTADANHKVKAKARDLQEQFRRMVLGATSQVTLLGAAELWELVNAIPSYTLSLTYQENATSGPSHVAIVAIRDYLRFLTDESGRLQRHIFDWNVRDYQGGVEVNREIEKSLTEGNPTDFWWLNNGVTVICSKASIIAKQYILDDVQIVNGLQTSHTIFRSLQGVPLTHPALDKSVLVRILVTGDPATRDLVIRATNRQTSVPEASLRATDEIQRNIELYFLSHGRFYDRRKNYYRNNGKRPDLITSVPLLAQATMAMGLGQANNSRARPSSLLKDDDDYGKIFSEKVPLEVYLWLAEAQKQVDSFLASTAAAAPAAERINLRFHLSMLATARLYGERVYAPEQLRRIVANAHTVTEGNLPTCLSDLRKWYSDYATATSDSMDKASKSSEFIDYVFDHAFPT